MPPLPTQARKRLGVGLKKLRTDADLTVNNVVDELGWGRHKLIRIESAQVRITQLDLRKLCKHYGAGSRETARLNELLEAADTRPWFQAYADLISVQLMEYIELEAMAAEIRMANTSVLPGLVQSEEYAAAVYASQPHYPDPDHAARLVEVRMKRQRVITDEGTILDATIGEGLLHTATGGRDVLRGQLDRLNHLVDLPNVTLRVLPFSAERAILTGGVSLFTFPSDSDPVDPPVAFNEYEGNMLLRDGDIEVRRFNRLLQHLASQALSPEDSKQLIQKRMDDV
ncbi:hypothetical protein GCM10023205_10480 [Yinghuangia aomiensis]|uniref:HTH cro/C1-type domain-containing protein n=1 Tax=Yinghuangia aomiensis TaxID=676205 RepID=A0ABP9GZX5_9ACTN